MFNTIIWCNKHFNLSVKTSIKTNKNIHKTFSYRGVFSIALQKTWLANKISYFGHMLKAATITSKCATHILKSFNHLPVHKTPPSLGNKRDVSQTKKVKVHFKYILPKDV